jgi:hypothetical protein
VVRTKPPCEKCGQPALVNMKSEDASGPTVRYLCLACADVEEISSARRDPSLNYSTILISVGLVVLCLSAMADWLAFGDSSGFGWKQYMGVLLAGVLILTASIVRISTLMVIGLLTATLTMLADLFQFGHERGFGWHQTIGVVFGIVMVAAGMLEARRQT